MDDWNWLKIWTQRNGWFFFNIWRHVLVGHHGFVETSAWRKWTILNYPMLICDGLEIRSWGEDPYVLFLRFFVSRLFGQKKIPEFRQHNWIFQGSTLTHPIGKHLRNGRLLAEKSWHFCMVSFLMRSCCATMAYVQICLVGATMKGAKLWCFGFLYRIKVGWILQIVVGFLTLNNPYAYSPWDENSFCLLACSSQALKLCNCDSFEKQILTYGGVRGQAIRDVRVFWELKGMLGLGCSDVPSGKWDDNMFG